MDPFSYTSISEPPAKNNDISITTNDEENRYLDSQGSNANANSKLKILFSSGVSFNSFKYFNNFFGGMNTILSTENYESFKDPIEFNEHTQFTFAIPEEKPLIQNDENENEINQDENVIDNFSIESILKSSIRNEQVPLSNSNSINKFNNIIKFDEKALQNSTNNSSCNLRSNKKNQYSNSNSGISKKSSTGFIESLPPMISWGKFKGCYDTRQYKCYRTDCHKQKNLLCLYCTNLPIIPSKLRLSIEASQLKSESNNNENNCVLASDDDDDDDEYFSVEFQEPVSSFRKAAFDDKRSENSVLNEFISIISKDEDSEDEVSESDSTSTTTSSDDDYSESQYSSSKFFLPHNDDFSSKIVYKNTAHRGNKNLNETSKASSNFKSPQSSTYKSSHQNEFGSNSYKHSNNKTGSLSRSRVLLSQYSRSKRGSNDSEKSVRPNSKTNSDELNASPDAKTNFKRKLKGVITSMNTNHNLR